jgi:hypothetical protein
MTTEEKIHPPTKDSYSYPSGQTYIFPVKPNEFYEAPLHSDDLINSLGRSRSIANEEVHKYYEKEGIKVLTLCQQIESTLNPTFDMHSHKPQESYEIEIHE